MGAVSHIPCVTMRRRVPAACPLPRQYCYDAYPAAARQRYTRRGHSILKIGKAIAFDSADQSPYVGYEIVVVGCVALLETDNGARTLPLPKLAYRE